MAFFIYLNMKKKLKIGITGGIGSGKTTVCHIFETLNIPVYYADERAKALMIQDKNLIQNIKNLLGENAYFEDGSLNRTYISEIVFHNSMKINALNALVHPAVLADGEAWHKKQINVPYTLKEAALHFESGNYKYFDKMITVFAPENSRIERVLLRGGHLSKQDIEARIATQMPEEEKMKRADFIIFNDGTQPLITQVLNIHHILINKILSK